MSIFSAMFAPRKSRVSAPAWPSTVSLPSPGFHTKRSLPAPRRATSSPLSAGHEVVAVTADQEVGALAACDGVVAEAAVDRQLRHGRRKSSSVDRVVAVETVDDERVVRALGVRDADERRQPRHGDGGSGAEHLDRIAGARPVDARSSSAAPSPPPSEAPRSISTRVTSVPDRSFTVIVSAPPSALKVDRLDVVHVHRDVGDVAGEAHAPAVRRDVDVSRRCSRR